MATEKNIKTRIILTHDDYNNLKGKPLKAGEVVLAKVGTTEAAGKVSEPIWMMKVGDGTSTFESCPWLVAPAADVYEWAKQKNLAVDAVPTLPISKIEGLTEALAGKSDKDHNHDDVYKKLQTAVAESGAADKTLKISQNENGEISVTPVAIQIAQSQVTGLDDALAGKADKVTGAATGNFAAFDDKGNLLDSGTTSSHFAAIDHDHNSVYKTIQDAVEKTGAADKTLTISQNANGVIDAKEVDIAITHDQVTDFDTAVTGVVNDLGITTDGIEDLGERLTTAEGEIDALQTAVTTTLPGQINAKVDQTAYNEKVAALEKADTYLDTAVKAAQAAAEEAQKDIDTFMGVIESDTAAVDTLNEIITLINSEDGKLSAALMAEINALKEKFNTDGKALEAVNADTVDGKHADAFATAEQGAKADSAVQSVSLASGSTNGTVKLTVDGTTTDNIAVKGLGSAAYTESDAYATAAQGTKADSAIQTVTSQSTDYITVSDITEDAVTIQATEKLTDAVALAESAIQSVAADAATGLTVNTVDGAATISFIDDVVFILDGGDASNLF